MRASRVPDIYEYEMTSIEYDLYTKVGISKLLRNKRRSDAEKVLVLVFGLYVIVYFSHYRILLSSIVATWDLSDNCRQRYVIVGRFRRIDANLKLTYGIYWN